MESRKSSDFVRLVKDLGDGYLSVYEFHSVVNGTFYIAEHEEERDGSYKWIGKSEVVEKDKGNRFYLQLKAEGWKYGGKYEMDICGYKHKAN